MPTNHLLAVVVGKFAGPGMLEGRFVERDGFAQEGVDAVGVVEDGGNAVGVDDRVVPGGDGGRGFVPRWGNVPCGPWKMASASRPSAKCCHWGLARAMWAMSVPCGPSVRAEEHREMAGERCGAVMGDERGEAVLAKERGQPGFVLNAEGGWDVHSSRCFARRKALDEPLDNGTEGVGARDVVQFNGNVDECPAFRREIGVEPGEGLGCGAGGGGDRAVRRFAEFCLEAADDGDDACTAAETAEEKFAARSLGQREKSARVDSAEVVEVLRSCRKLEELLRRSCRLKADETVEWEFGDALFHFTWKRGAAAIS